MIKFIIAAVLFSIPLGFVRAEIVIIANSGNHTNTLSPNEIQDIFMGRKRSFPDGSSAQPFDEAAIRAEFYQKLTHRPIEQIDAFWARLMFSGQASPPTVLPDDKAVINAVISTPGAIGYISKNNANKNIKVLLTLK